jgi:hypothetical protein
MQTGKSGKVVVATLPLTLLIWWEQRRRLKHCAPNLHLQDLSKHSHQDRVMREPPCPNLQVETPTQRRPRLDKWVGFKTDNSLRLSFQEPAMALRIP